ncbi:MAG: hypothetical protein WDN00_05615 [Limisphaerales bacterium]
MNPILQSIIASVVSSVVSSGLITFWIQKRIEKKNDAELATLTAKLSRDNELEITAFKSKLEIAAIERNIKLTNVFEKQADVIAEMFKQLVELKEAAEDCTDRKEETERNFRILAFKFRRYFITKQLYVPFNSQKLLAECTKTIHELTGIIKTADQAQQLGNNDIHAHSMTQYFNRLNNLPVMIEALEIDFKKLLGMPTDKEERKNRHTIKISEQATK